jgi:hypothetical protein
MTSNNNGKCKLKEEAESSMTRKRLQLSDNDISDDDSSDSLEEEMEEEVLLKETSMNQLDTSEEKSLAKHAGGIIFSDDGDTTSPSPEPHTPKSHQRSDENNNDDDDDFSL